MRKDLTDITVVLDRSGSMFSCQSDAEGGLNQFIKEQKALPGGALFSLVQFDHEYEIVHDGVPIDLVPHIPLHPRGSTALYDAVGKAIGVTGERLAKMNEADRPGLVVFVILTDGENNASKEVTMADAKKLIARQETEWQWQFVFLGANPDAFQEGVGMGVRALANYTPATSKQAYGAASASVGRMRGATLRAEPVKNEFTEEEKKAMSGESTS